ncbi:NDR1/HIN1-like protein 13 [Brachypodium distachyon]|uniref:Late embryogenesis abundant protein LEA-2 subgroup domain-containing protein n=1 Tax=Brachypodium distachyon TaxID=15368 RepID=I1HSP6_BRADI|nr:NDR1/HIN1-like protein 13 [Brachypodium distachyon]KQK10259.1 hypothetical protein BRADI_2g53027v3 [Brachypodium distachyon]|eukprot:XP_003564453.1 NDR1/HIN1-like protein 13 [Brachypodium distachyon]
MMSDGRVHPAAATSSDFSGEMNHSATYSSSDPSSSPLYSFHFEKPIPPPPQTHAPLQQQQPPHKPLPGTYVVQVPKDKVFRVPPPENARLFQHYARRAKRRRSGCFSSCCLCLFLALLALAILLAALAGVAYLALQPQKPSYAVRSLAVSGIGNASVALAPRFDATIRAENPNGKIGVRYDAGSGMSVSYGGVSLAAGAWPAFYQAPRSATVFVATAKGAGIRLSERAQGQMAAAERLRSVPLDVELKVPVRLQIGALKTWAMPVTVRCAVAVDRLAVDAKVVSAGPCDVDARSLFWRN